VRLPESINDQTSTVSKMTTTIPKAPFTYGKGIHSAPAATILAVVKELASQSDFASGDLSTRNMASRFRVDDLAGGAGLSGGGVDMVGDREERYEQSCRVMEAVRAVLHSL
jgi:hypothetical protein